MGFDWYTHGLWFVGTFFLFVGGMITGNLQWVDGTTETSFLLTIILAFALLLVGGLSWISAAANAREEEKMHRRDMF